VVVLFESRSHLFSSVSTFSSIIGLSCLSYHLEVDSCMPAKHSTRTSLIHTRSTHIPSVSTSTSASSTSASTRSSSPVPPSHTSRLSPSTDFLLSLLRFRRRTRRSPQLSPKMFSSRKYSPLPTSSGPQRKRAGAGLSTWKRWTILAMALLILVALGFTRYSHKTYGEEEVWDAEST